ncbi:unnamed protein product [Protopolystoma xenopodis]|uniref:Fibronectin type-III domain-containing protein n=1 Tax=Protopolystoma xenopodis TaxID=117903 RepID=A0A448XQA9_9PLAT|nr:unnamed protein product [Protopolystoma xenopodis]
MLSTTCGGSPTGSLSTQRSIPSELYAGARPGSNKRWCSLTIESLLPATRYAVYVEVKYLPSYSGIISQLAYFTTQAINPSPPSFVRVEPLPFGRLHLSWLPPRSPNGVVSVYLVWLRRLRQRRLDFGVGRDEFCFGGMWV